jgi:nitrate reductase alpha subunit
MAQPFDVKDWKRGECEPIPGKTMRRRSSRVERDYPEHSTSTFTSLGPLMTKLGNGGKGIAWNTEHEVRFAEGAERHRPEGAHARAVPRRSKAPSTRPR